MGKTIPITLTPEQETWLKEHYKHTKNEEIVKKLGVSPRSVNRLAVRMGLKKSWQFMKQCQAETATAARRSHMINGTYPKKGYSIPNREKSYFRKGEKNIERFGVKKEKERIRKSNESRAKLRKLETARALYGLPRQTKLNVVKRPREQALMRYYLKKRGYIVERGGMIFYYGNETKRSPDLESRPRTGFTFLPLINQQ